MPRADLPFCCTPPHPSGCSSSQTPILPVPGPVRPRPALASPVSPAFLHPSSSTAGSDSRLSPDLKSVFLQGTPYTQRVPHPSACFPTSTLPSLSALGSKAGLRRDLTPLLPPHALTPPRALSPSAFALPWPRVPSPLGWHQGLHSVSPATGPECFVPRGLFLQARVALLGMVSAPRPPGSLQTWLGHCRLWEALPDPLGWRKSVVGTTLRWLGGGVCSRSWLPHQTDSPWQSGIR